jgi:predicted nucleotidyltransferase
MVEEKIKYSKEQLAEFCVRNGIKKLSFFGSILTDRFTDDSDVDMLVEFEEKKKPGLLGLVGMEIELTEIIGRKVDLRTPEELSRHFRNDVIREAQIEYGNKR